MEVYMNDERNIHRLVAHDMLKDAWNTYNGKVEVASSFLRRHGFTDEEIQQIIEVSRS